jgi:Zn-dependent alcohol dehydrogenase
MMVFLQTHLMRAECLLTGLVMCAVGGVIFSALVMKKNTIGIVGLGKIGNAVARGFAGAKLDVRPQQVRACIIIEA